MDRFCPPLAPMHPSTMLLVLERGVRLPCRPPLKFELGSHFETAFLAHNANRDDRSATTQWCSLNNFYTDSSQRAIAEVVGELSSPHRCEVACVVSRLRHNQCPVSYCMIGQSGRTTSDEYKMPYNGRVACRFPSSVPTQRVPTGSTQCSLKQGTWVKSKGHAQLTLHQGTNGITIELAGMKLLARHTNVAYMWVPAGMSNLLVLEPVEPSMQQARWLRVHVE
jgi:hypothetical protein